MVSRTSERMDSLRRNRRGRCVTAGLVLSLRLEVFVVISLSGEVVGARTVRRTEFAAVAFVRAVNAEVTLADRADFEMAGLIPRRAATRTNPVMDLGHRSKYPVIRTVKSNPGRSLTVGSRLPTMPVPSRTWRCSSDG